MCQGVFQALRQVRNKTKMAALMGFQSNENVSLTILFPIHPCPSPLEIPMLWKIIIILHCNNLLLKLLYAKPEWALL